MTPELWDTEAGRAVVEMLRARLADLRVTNDKTGLDATATALLRGRISEIKDLLGGAAPKQKPVPAASARLTASNGNDE
jgi:hypothetical protein